MDRDLRYVWIDTLHPNFDPVLVVGKRDDELVDADVAAEIMSIKRSVLLGREHCLHVIRFLRSDGGHCYTVSAYPIRSSEGEIQGVLTLGVDST